MLSLSFVYIFALTDTRMLNSSDKKLNTFKIYLQQILKVIVYTFFFFRRIL